MALAASVVSLSSCEKETEGQTYITHYPIYTFSYSDYVSLGDDFSPAFTATCNEKDVTNEIEYIITDINGEEVESIDTDIPGIYTIAYYYVNPDKVNTSTERTVYIYNPDLEISLEGEYIIDMDKTQYVSKEWSFTEAAENYGFAGELSIKFTEILPGFYKCDDLLAKWYQQLRGYYESNNREYDFRAGAIVFLDEDGNLTLLSSSVPAWGDALDYIKDAHYDATTGDLSYFVSYAGEVVQISVVAEKQIKN